MNRNSRSGSRLFFIEFLIVLFFFLIISTVCLKLFSRAHQITARANALSGAQTTAASVAAVLSATDGPAEAVAAYFPDAMVSDTELSLFFDQDFQSLSDYSAAAYLMTVTFSDGTEKAAQITVTDYHHEVLYELPVSIHRPMTREEALQ
jgi:hypothetical protein